MGNVSIFKLVGQESRAKKKAAPKKKATNKKTKPTGWGTPEEQYRRLCLLAQFCRYAYYVESKSIVDDQLYDRLERVILHIEDKHREIIDSRRSPTGKPGSSKREDYPRTVLDLWYCHGDDPRTFDSVAAVIEKAIVKAGDAFDVKIL